MHRRLFLLLCCCVIGGRALSQEIKPHSSSTIRADTAVTRIKRTAVLLRVTFSKEGVPFTSEGTGFFVFYPDKRGGENFGFCYLVTNRHVANPGVDEGRSYPVQLTQIKVNLLDSNKGSAFETVPLSPSLHWYYPTDDSVDLALLPILPDQKKYDYTAIPISQFATRDIVDAQNVAEGDNVLFTGYFYQFPGAQRFQPIVREGVLAMLPDEKLETTLRKFGNLYLADIHAFEGNSGSPLFVNLGGLRNGNISSSGYALLGIVSGFYQEDAEFKLTVATTYTGKLGQNSGIALAVPVDELKVLLDTAELQRARDAEIARLPPKR